MNIRKYILIFVTTIITVMLLFVLFYQIYFSSKLNTKGEKVSNYSRIVKTEDKDIKIYKNEQWETIKLKGVKLSSFAPGYGRFKTRANKKDIRKWLEEITALNANVIQVPYIQSASFYNAIYDYNLNRENPIYIIHEIMLDEATVLSNYNAFDKEIIKNLKRDIRNTIDILNGKGIILNNKRSHSGIYLKDISKYNLGFIIGNNTNPEIVTLTNSKNKSIEKYEGEYFSVLKGEPFEVFVAQMLDYASKYEIKRYKRLSLVSFLTSVETDVVRYKHESNLTKSANIDFQNIKFNKTDNLFISYDFHPNSVDFLDYEYDETRNEDDKSYDETTFFKHLVRLNELYDLPLVISDTGISSSRGISRIDEADGFNRGGFTEEEQGEGIVNLLQAIYDSGSAGGIINSWQDDWTKITSFSLVEDYLDESASSYWQDFQSSDESFGLLKFEYGKKEDKVYIDGDISEWDSVKPLLDESNMKLKVRSDTSNIYVLIEKQNWSLNNDSLYLGIDVTPFSGSKIWKDEAEFSSKADFAIKLKGYNESRIVVNERYNLFNYLYKYYNNTIDKEDKVPEKDSEEFHAIYLLNRNKFYLKDSDMIIPPAYYETGKFVHGDDNPSSKEFNSLADFNKTGDIVELKIPWMLLNIKNPLDKIIYGDFYLDGLSSHKNINDIGFSIYFKASEREILSKEVRYNMEEFKEIEYFQRLKESYYIVRNYWETNPRPD